MSTNYKVGDKFEHWTIISEYSRNNYGQERVLCECTCGKIMPVILYNILTGKSRSCRCRGKMKPMKSPERKTWYGIIGRCHNKADPAYTYYGGRGIEVCERWRSDFNAFYADMGDRPVGMSLDRVDNNGPYSPENCRWATAKQQAQNRRSSHLVTYQGETRSISEWEDFIGYKRGFILDRLARGWLVADAIETPPRVIPQGRFKKNSLLVELDGVVCAVSQLAKRYKINYDTLHYRITNGWNITDALMKPARS